MLTQVCQANFYGRFVSKKNTFGIICMHASVRCARSSDSSLFIGGIKWNHFMLKPS
jgi:hypothetical protein